MTPRGTWVLWCGVSGLGQGDQRRAPVVELHVLEARLALEERIVEVVRLDLGLLLRAVLRGVSAGQARGQQTATSLAEKSPGALQGGGT